MEMSSIAIIHTFITVWCANVEGNTELKSRDNIPLLLEGKTVKVVLNWFKWNLPPHATH